MSECYVTIITDDWQYGCYVTIITDDWQYGCYLTIITDDWQYGCYVTIMTSYCGNTSVIKQWLAPVTVGVLCNNHNWLLRQ